MKIRILIFIFFVHSKRFLFTTIQNPGDTTHSFEFQFSKNKMLHKITQEKYPTSKDHTNRQHLKTWKLVFQGKTNLHS
ncbi:hypothetical protein LEP1GSC043_2507 [Leptospira weilii str. Ecochallenge]|uniref:Uncharacterized protein n=1 Tax=Leptospira weilii str. Ecochallenge TaxID=1049986 RepID=N1UG49_9LEPT|nr:hypothetical protein LEP1GSC043_2507 [Leptospira weilii str. Ecochallenge]